MMIIIILQIGKLRHRRKEEVVQYIQLVSSRVGI